MDIANYLNKLNREMLEKCFEKEEAYIEFKKFYDEVVDLMKFKSDMKFAGVNLR